MLTSKQRAQLRAMANAIDTIVTIGKDGITEPVVRQAADALRARELIKCRVLDNSMLGAAEACALLAERTGSDSVQVIGTRFVLFRENPEKRKAAAEKEKAARAAAKKQPVPRKPGSGRGEFGAKKGTGAPRKQSGGAPKKEGGGGTRYGKPGALGKKPGTNRAKTAGGRNRTAGPGRASGRLRTRDKKDR